EDCAGDANHATAPAKSCNYETTAIGRIVTTGGHSRWSSADHTVQRNRPRISHYRSQLFVRAILSRWNLHCRDRDRNLNAVERIRPDLHAVSASGHVPLAELIEII